MIDYPLEIGTRNGPNTPLCRRDADDAQQNGQAWLSFTCPVCVPATARTRCRIDGNLYRCYSDGCPVRVIDPTNRGIGLDRGAPHPQFTPRPPM